MWAIDENIPLRMWEVAGILYYKDHMDLFESPSVENYELPNIYRSAKVTLMIIGTICCKSNLLIIGFLMRWPVDFQLFPMNAMN